MHESATNVDGKSTGKPAASHEAVDGYVFTECWLLVREQALETTTHLQVKPRYLTSEDVPATARNPLKIRKRCGIPLVAG
jgi:hypothetical protein